MIRTRDSDGNRWQLWPIRLGWARLRGIRSGWYRHDPPLALGDDGGGVMGAPKQLGPRERAEAHLRSARDSTTEALAALQHNHLREAQDHAQEAEDHLFHAATDLALTAEPLSKSAPTSASSEEG